MDIWSESKGLQEGCLYLIKYEGTKTRHEHYRQTRVFITPVKAFLVYSTHVHYGNILFIFWACSLAHPSYVGSLFANMQTLTLGLRHAT